MSPEAERMMRLDIAFVKERIRNTTHIPFEKGSCPIWECQKCEDEAKKGL